MILNIVASLFKSSTLRTYRKMVVGKTKKEVRRLLRSPKRA